MIDEKKVVKKYGINMVLCAGIIGMSGLFIFYGMDSLVLGAILITAVVFLFNLLLLSLSSMLNSCFEIKEWLKKTGSTVLLVFNVLTAVCGLVYIVQDGMMFNNVHDEESRIYLQSLEGYHEIAFTGENGKTYHGMMYRESDEIAPLVIYFGGNGEVSYRNLRNRGDKNDWQYYPGCHYLYIDYDGYGLNEGRPHYRNMYEMALAAYDYAVTLPYVDNERIVVMAFSLGTGNAIYLAANRPVAGLITATPYASGYDLYNGMLPIFYGPMRLLVKQKLPSSEYAPKVNCPVLVIASKRDEAIPFASSLRIAELFGGDVDFMTLENVSHNNTFKAEGVLEKIQSFIVGVTGK